MNEKEKKSTPKGRIQKLNAIIEILKANGGKITFGKLLSQMDLKYGTTRETLWSYLDTLKNAGKVDFPEIFIIYRENDVEIRLV